jgi:transposase
LLFGLSTNNNALRHGIADLIREISGLGITKRGDTYLRTLLIHGARSVLSHAKEPEKWLQEIGKRRPKTVVAVALANKMARTIRALLAHDRHYESSYMSAKSDKVPA